MPKKLAASSRLMPKGGLGQVVGAEGEEFGGRGDLAGLERRARQFDHGADLIFDGALGLGGDRCGDGVDALFHQIELGFAGDQRHHDFRRRLCVPVARPASTAASKMARACISAISG